MHVHPSSPAPRPTAAEHGVQTVAVIGAGAMGQGIAAANLQAGIRVLTSDIDSAAAESAVARLLADHSASGVPGSGSSPPAAVIHSDEQFAEADLIIEAVAEDQRIKTELLSRLERFISPHTLLASNSSSIPMARLADCLQQPDRFCGLHFCYPVDQRPLVEVIGADTTSSTTLQRVENYARAIGMSPVTVRDAPGFLLNRLLVPYLNEALELVLEQADLQELEAAAIRFGLPKGPLAQLDDFGLDVALSVGRTLYQSFPDRIGPSEMLIAMYKAGRLGRKSGHGFHFDNGVRSETIVPAVQDIINRRARGSAPVPHASIERRLLLSMLLEATRALEEGLVDSSQIVDQVLHDGLGMTDRYRGLFGWADSVGGSQILKWLEPLQSLGPRFEPTPLLLELAADSGTRLTSWKSAA